MTTVPEWAKVHHFPMYSNSRHDNPTTACGASGSWVPSEAAPDKLCAKCDRKVDEKHRELLTHDEY